MPFFRRNQVKRRWQRELPLVQTITPEEVFYEYEYDYIYEDSYGYTTDYGTMTTRVPSDRKSLPSIRSDTGTTIPSIIDDPFDFNHSVPIDLKLGQPFEIDIRDYANLPTAIRTYLTKRPYWLTLKDTFFIRGNAPLNLNIGDSIEIDILLELLNNRSTISFKLNVTQSAFFWNKLDRDVTVKAIEHYTETVTEHYNETVTEHYTDTVTEHYTERVTTTDTVTETVTETVDVPISVILLVDRSGSMATANRIGSAKAGMRQILGELNQGDRLGILTFSDSVSTVVNINSPLNNASALTAINAITTGGATNYAPAMRAARDALAGATTEKKLITMLTDGNPSDTDQDFHEIARSIKAHGIQLDTVGTGDASATLLRALANSGGGVYYAAPNPNSIPDIFDESLSTRTVTRQVTRQVPKVIEVDRTRQVQVPRTRQVQVPRTRQVQVDRTRQVVTRINLEDYAQDGILDSNLWQPATLPDWIVRENNELVITPPATTVGTQTDITLTYDVYPITLTIFVR